MTLHTFAASRHFIFTGRSPRLCSVPGCYRRHYARGWCQAHYLRWWRHGSTTLSPYAFNPGHHNALKTQCPHGHPYDDDNTRWRQDPAGRWRRECRECKRDRDRANYARRYPRASTPS
jgi:hypothetical protein